MKPSIRYLFVIPLTGLLALTACCHTEPPEETPPPASPAPAGPNCCLVNLSKKAPPMVSVGDTYSYDLVATAACDVADVTVTETIAPGASYVSSEPAAVQEGNQLIWHVGNMARGETKTARITLKAEKVGELANCATVSALPRTCESTTIGKAQITIHKTGPARAAVGQDVIYTVTVQNVGNSTARNVVVTDPVPDGLSSATGQRELSFNLGELPAGDSRNLEVRLRADKRGQISNKAFVSSSNAGKAETETSTTVLQTGLKIEKRTDSTELFINRAATYNITVSNPGDVDLNGVMVTDSAAPETIIAAADGSTVNGTTASWNLGTMRAGETKSLAIKILSKVPGRFCDTATATSAEGFKDSTQVCTVWKGITGILLEMGDDPDPIQVGEITKFHIRVTNQGSTIDVGGLNIVAVLPPELDVVPGTISDGGVLDGKTITWPTVPAVPPKASVFRTYTVKALKTGDARSKASITTTMRQEPIEQTESTTVY